MLVHRRKTNKYQELTVGEVVLIGDNNTKRIRWPLGVLVEISYGKRRYLEWKKLGLLMV